MLTDKELRDLKPGEKLYKRTDRDGMYIAITPGGVLSFRYDYRVRGRKETLVIGRYDSQCAKRPARAPGDALKYGMVMSLAEARTLLMQARSAVERGQSPAIQKAEGRGRAVGELDFGAWADKFFEEAKLAESTKAMRRSIFERDLRKTFGRKKLEEITAASLLALCEKIKRERNAPATAVHVREIVMQVFNHAKDKGVKVGNPAAEIRAKAIATFSPRERALAPAEIRLFLDALDGVGTLPHLKLGLRLILLTLMRKGELINARWAWVDFERATLKVPSEYMKAGRPHMVYLSQQALDILVALKTMAGSSPYLLPGRYETDQPISEGTLNRVIEASLKRMHEQYRDDPAFEFPAFTVHDLRRTASTLLHEADYNSDWIEKALAHEQRGVRAVYNKAEYAEQRREMLQAWADMLDLWRSGSDDDPKQTAVAARAARGVE